MKVYKFGGASVKDAAGIRNMAEIVSGASGNLVIVVSAFGKTTNALEKVLKAWISEDKNYQDLLDEVFHYHHSVINELFAGKLSIAGNINNSFALLREYLSAGRRGVYDFEYDQVVSYGELWSTIIVAGFLETLIPDTGWIDIRINLLTDDRFRDANILWSESRHRLLKVFDFKARRIYITQGFIEVLFQGKLLLLEERAPTILPLLSQSLRCF